MAERTQRKLVTEDGAVYVGEGFGAPVDRVCELVFNTSMAGYQEILSDPSYTDQAVVMTYPTIGNYGLNADDWETDTPSLGALIVREACEEPSNFRCSETLDQAMRRLGIPGLSGIDTRKLTRSIRDLGSRRALLTDAERPTEECLSILGETEGRHDQVARVSTREIYTVSPEHPRFHVAAIDCGMKKNIVRELVKRGCRVTVLPWNTGADAIRAMDPDGVFLSNGPGDPEDVPETIGTVRALRREYPLFGICLGHQILALSYGAKTYKLKFGHRGGNHPVKDLSTGKIEITAQNHSYAVDADSLADTGLTVTRVNLLDGTVEGLAAPRDRAFSVQYHPESAPGPEDSGDLFDQFIERMEASHAEKD